MDPALDALDALIETLSADRGRIDLILEKARYVQTLRTAGLDWTNVVERENHPLIVELLTEIIETLHVSSSRFRRHQARVLRAEGMAMERIAELFGVTRQRVSQLLRAADEPDPSSFGAYRRLPEAARWARLSVTLARAEDGTPACFISQVEDLTDRHLAAKSEQRAHRAFAALVDVMPDAVVGLDPDDRITLFNRAAEQLWGRRASEVLGMAGTVLLPERQHPAHRARLVRLATSAVTANRSPNGADAARPALLSPALHGDGHEFPVEIFVAVTDHDGRQAFTAVVRPGAEAVTP